MLMRLWFLTAYPLHLAMGFIVGHAVTAAVIGMIG